MKKSTNFATLLQEHALKITPLRLRILEVLDTTTVPLSIEALQKKLRGKGNIVTLYRALASFEVTGIVQALTLKDATRYQLATIHQHHIICRDCGTIETIPFCIEKLERGALKKSKKFKLIADHNLEFFGTCRKCT
ncbi:MAG TPA: Fur family transcriptional regulator [Candidatus Paceibacterota bacterium]|nr:Fur family transcriptional regulator [Candidatus Paceibacterota bacterium]